MRRKVPFFAFDFFITHRISGKTAGDFHCCKAQQLRHVILEHITQCSGMIVIFTALLYTNLFSGCNLNMTDIFRTPQRFKNNIGKTQHKYILHCFFAQIVVYTVDLIFGKIFMQTVNSTDC